MKQRNKTWKQEENWDWGWKGIESPCLPYCRFQNWYLGIWDVWACVDSAQVASSACYSRMWVTPIFALIYPMCNTTLLLTNGLASNRAWHIHPRSNKHYPALLRFLRQRYLKWMGKRHAPCSLENIGLWKHWACSAGEFHHLSFEIHVPVGVIFHDQSSADLFSTMLHVCYQLDTIMVAIRTASKHSYAQASFQVH